MFGVALLTSALFAFGTARIYNRCELAGDLLRLGVDKDHLATWVCIAFHESRFDTAARNPHSGDHGLLQISELYWCGAGKACGVPCSAFRDDDISDDVECAQQIYKEHTRLQGDGFLAWVVYPHHCRYNAKKYLADCDGVIKDHAYKPDDRGRSLRTQYQIEEHKNENIPFYNKFPNIDDLKPPYIAINAILRGTYEDRSEEKIDHIKSFSNQDKKHPFEWLNNNVFEAGSGNFPTFKVDNIDELKPPVYTSKTSFMYSEPSTTTTVRTTTIDPALRNIKPPNPRRIETNQFRRRKMMIFKSYPENSSDGKNVPSLSQPSSSTYEEITVKTIMTTQSSDIRHETYINKSSIDLANKIDQIQHNISLQARHDATLRPFRTEISSKELSANKTTFQDDIFTTSSPSYTPFQSRPSITYNNNLETSTIKYTTNLTNDKENKNIRNQPRSTTIKPQVLTHTTPFPRLTYSQPSPNKDYTKALQTETNIWSNRGSFRIRQETESTTVKPRSTRPWITFTSRTRSTPITLPDCSTPRPTTNSPITTSKTVSTQSNIGTTSKPASTTQFSIFDLYLKPTKRPKIVINFPEFKDSPSRIRIFSGGTTSLPPSYSNSRNTNSSMTDSNRKIS